MPIDFDLLVRNVEEIVTEEELKALVRGKTNPVTYCGYEVSGPVHIGHMVSANKQIDFQEAGLKVKVLLADVHTLLNRKGSKAWIDDMAEYWKQCFIGLGLNKAEFVLGSEFQFNREYMEDVLQLCLHSTLQRALRSMQEVARDIEHAHVSQIIYPIMQATDIKALGVDIAHGGMEQRKIHMLAREMLPEVGYNKPICVHTPLLYSLQAPTEEDMKKEPLSKFGVPPRPKMSSSKPETMIAVHESDESIKKKIMNAYCPLGVDSSGRNPILEICRLLLFPRLEKMEIERDKKFGGNTAYDTYARLEADYLAKKLHPMDLKNAVAKNLTEMLAPVRKHLADEGIAYRPEKPK